MTPRGEKVFQAYVLMAAAGEALVKAIGNESDASKMMRELLTASGYLDHAIKHLGESLQGWPDVVAPSVGLKQRTP